MAAFAHPPTSAPLLKSHNNPVPNYYPLRHLAMMMIVLPLTNRNIGNEFGWRIGRALTESEMDRSCRHTEIFCGAELKCFPSELFDLQNE